MLCTFSDSGVGMVGRMSRTKRADTLSRVKLFERCSKTELAAVAELTTPISVAPGRELCKEGGLGHEFFVIVDGTATITQRGKDTRRIGPGTAFGEIALLDRGPRTATVRAATPMTLLVLNPREFGDLLLRAPNVGRKLLATMAARLRTTEKKIARLEARVAKERAAARA